MLDRLSATLVLPEDSAQATLIGRVWVPGTLPGPSVVAIREGGVYDLTHVAPTVSHLFNAEDPLALVRAATSAPRLGALKDILANSGPGARDERALHLLAPIDLQAVKAAGVTFVRSLLERVIEEHTLGDPAAAKEVRARIEREVGGDLAVTKPGSEAAERCKEALIARGLWSQYLEVGIGPHAEIFTKAQPMSAVGVGAEIGLHPDSSWNNPEPELVLVVNARGRLVGATLGNDVNLRDFEGRSALLLGRSKDNNASCAVGPFVRLLDESFGLEDVRTCDIALRVEGLDGFKLEGGSSMAEISRDVLDLISQTIGRDHQYPDGFVLFTGTMFVPIADRHGRGQGFTHQVGDIVTISSPKLGSLVNRVNISSAVPAWTFGAGALMRNLAARGLL